MCTLAAVCKQIKEEKEGVNFTERKMSPTEREQEKKDIKAEIG